MNQRASLWALCLLILACRSGQSAGSSAPESTANEGCATEVVSVERVRSAREAAEYQLLPGNLDANRDEPELFVGQALWVHPPLVGYAD